MTCVVLLHTDCDVEVFPEPRSVKHCFSQAMMEPILLIFWKQNHLHKFLIHTCIACSLTNSCLWLCSYFEYNILILASLTNFLQSNNQSIQSHCTDIAFCCVNYIFSFLEKSENWTYRHRVQVLQSSKCHTITTWMSLELGHCSHLTHK